jgi:hypothetical protein
MAWLRHAAPSVRRLLFTVDRQPICPVCGRVVAAGAPAVVCAAVLADASLRRQLARSPGHIWTREPDVQEAWWQVHGDCHQQLRRQQVQELDERIELALRMSTRSN